MGKYRIEILHVGKFSWLITPTKISHQRNFTYTEYNPARVCLRDCGLRINTREKAYCTRGYHKNWDGTMGEVLDCEVEANNAKDSGSNEGWKNRRSLIEKDFTCLPYFVHRASINIPYI